MQAHCARSSLRLLFSLFAFFFLAPGLSVQAQTTDGRDLGLQPVRSFPGSDKRYALIVGIDQYADTQISSLGGASNDAQSLSDALVRYAGFKPENVILLSSTQPAERQPTRGNILRRLSNLSTIVPKDGMLLFSFAGHGIERQGHAFLLPSDAQVSDDVDLLEQTAINVEQVREKIKRTGVGQVLLILDACRNDPSGRGEAANELSEAYTRALRFDIINRDVKAFATLFATGVGQRAYEYKERKQGYFTWALVEGLKGEAANEKGEVTLAGLIKYLQERVPKKVALDLGKGKEQRPYAEIGGYKADELVIAITEKKAANAQQQQADAAAFELAYWESIKESKNPEDFKAYLKEFPVGRFASLARNRITALSARPATEGPKSGVETVSIRGADELGLAGTWFGIRAMVDGTAMLTISGSRGDTFTGELQVNGFKVAVVGHLNLKTRQVSIRETKVLQEGDGAAWQLTSYAGSLAPNRREMSGTIAYSRGDKASYAWSFSRE